MRGLLSLLLVCFLVMACQKEVNFADGINSTSSVRCTSCSFLPVCDSTQLTYIDSSAMGVDTTASTLMILGDTTISGRRFTKISSSSLFNQGLLYNCDGGEYKIYQPVPNLGYNIDTLLQAAGLPTGSITIPSHIQTTILKANAAAVTAWSDTVIKFSPFPLFNVVAKLDYKLEQKGTQRTVLGKLYRNVIHINSKLNVVIPLIPPQIDVSVDYYFAEGIGIIETRTTSNGALQAQSRLYQYKIK